MASYYLNHDEQGNGDHEVHRQGCSWMPEPENRERLGEFSDGIAAVSQAKRLHPYWQINGCAYCSPESNTDR